MDEVYKANDNPTVQEILDQFNDHPRVCPSPRGPAPVIWVGEKDSYAGKTVVDFAGGLGAELDELKALITAGVGTFVCMHMDADIVKALQEDNRCNVLCMGHMASDSIGFNQILDAWEARGVEVTRIGGLV